MISPRRQLLQPVTIGPTIVAVTARPSLSSDLVDHAEQQLFDAA
jgi:hypothetical protein